MYPVSHLLYVPKAKILSDVRVNALSKFILSFSGWVYYKQVPAKLDTQNITLLEVKTL
jgi:hypothetical protein